MATLKKKDVGSLIQVTVTEGGVALDISDAVTKTLKLLKPNGVAIERDASFDAEGGVNGVLKYITVEGDIDYDGLWIGQVLIVMPDGRWHTDDFSFTVENIIEVTP